MGLTVVQKSDLRKRRADRPTIGLVLAGGAISGGAFKLGGLIALNTYLDNRKVTDLDVYVGVSAGAFLAAPLSAGIPPEELMRSIQGRSSIITQFRPWHFYYPNTSEYLSRPTRLVKDAVSFIPGLAAGVGRALRSPQGGRLARRFLTEPSYPNAERFMAPIIRELTGAGALTRGPLSYLPSGVFDNGKIEEFIRDNLRRNRMPNNFHLLNLERKNSLYIAATNLNTANRTLFGHDEDTTATISEAVQASSAIPGFFRPVQIGPNEYVDGGVRRTANIMACARKGADLIICYNPFRPYANVLEGFPGRDPHSMGELGIGVILDQIFRTLLHSRLQQGVKRLELDPEFKGDLLLLEPTETDSRMFNISPIAFWKRALAAEAGYLSVKATLERHHARLTRVFDAYGIRTNLQRLKEDESALRVARRTDDEVFNILEQEQDSDTQRLYVVR
ncbi:MAG: NTE family protein [Myxococcota bacterium]|jgi:NTE family protein